MELTPEPVNNRHHLIGKSLKDEFNTGENCNIITMNTLRHKALHALFGCLLTPKEQVREFSYLIESVLSEEARELFNILSNMKDREFYNPKVLKRKAFRN